MAYLQRHGTFEHLRAKLTAERLMLVHRFNVAAQRVRVRCPFVTLRTLHWLRRMPANVLPERAAAAQQFRANVALMALLFAHRALVSVRAHFGVSQHLRPQRQIEGQIEG